jgi:hypothetical protein
MSLPALNRTELDAMQVEDRLDALLAESFAHRAALQQIATAVFPTAEARSGACEDACSAFETLCDHMPLPDRAHMTLQRAIEEIDRIFHERPSCPRVDDTAS